MNDFQEFREKIRLLERSLGLLKPDTSTWLCKNITLAQCHALIEIGRKGCTTLKELSQILVLDPSTTSRTVDSLVRKDYVQRVTSETDRRSISITLTNEGQVLFQDIEQNMDQNFKKVFRRIPEEKQNEVLDSLDLIVRAFL